MQITYLRVAMVVARLQPRLDHGAVYSKARSRDAAYLYRLSAAHRHGLFAPFDADAQELDDWLRSINAGRQLCRDAWDCFMDDAIRLQSRSA